MKKENYILSNLIQHIIKVLPDEINKATGWNRSRKFCQSNLEEFFKQTEELLLNSKYIDGVIDQQTLQDIGALSIRLFGFNLIDTILYPDIIQIINRLNPSCFHISGNTITKAENIYCMEGLNDQLSKNVILDMRIDKLFQDLSVVSGQALLRQMQLLPQKNNLDPTIESHENRTQIRLMTIEYILLNLLINSEHCHKTIISRALANSLKVDYDSIIDKYMIYRESQKEFKLGQETS